MTIADSSMLHSRFDRLAPRYVRRTAGSRRINEEQRPVLAHPRASNRFNRRWKDLVYPIIADRAAGARMWDVDGNEYIDLTMGLGALLFGHRPHFLDAALREQLDRANHLGAESALAGEVASLVARATGHERVAFVNTGSEAVMTAVRIARAVTGRPGLVQFAGSYHGWYDGLIARRAADGSSVAPAPGMHDAAVEDTVLLDYGEPAALERIRELGPRVAAVLVEPIQSIDIGLQPREFVQQLRTVADEIGAALIFDEMVTGFRLGQGGAEDWYGVRADIGTYGKVLGGGLPIGILAGDSTYLDAIDGGAWVYRDDSGPDASRTLFAGTFSRNPMSMAAARAVLREIDARGDAMYRELATRAEEFATALRSAVAVAPAEYTVKQCGSLIVVEGGSEEAGELLSYELGDRGVFCWVGGTWYLSTEHTDDDCAAVVDAVRAACKDMERP